MTREGNLRQEKENFGRGRRTMVGEGGLWQENENFGRMRKTMAGEGENWTWKGEHNEEQVQAK